MVARGECMTLIRTYTYNSCNRDWNMSRGSYKCSIDSVIGINGFKILLYQQRSISSPSPNPSLTYPCYSLYLVTGLKYAE